MSKEKKSSLALQDHILASEDTLDSSISLSIGENSIRIKEKAKDSEHKSVPVVINDDQDKWWLKRSEIKLALSRPQKLELNVKLSSSPSPDVSSSMAEFLAKEKLCKILTKSELETKDKDDTLCDILASAAFEKYPSDFENATDEDIGSILEEMSKIAGALSSNSGPEYTKSGNNNENPTEEECSVEELLQEAVKLVKQNDSNISNNNFKSDTLVLENNSDPNNSLVRVRQLEDDIFQMIQVEVHKETEKIKRSPEDEHGTENSPGIGIVYENITSLKPAKNSELQVKKFDEHKIKVSSSSDLDDNIERHFKSEECTSRKDEDEDNLHKEITDVDKDFFGHLLNKSKDENEGGISGTPSFGQEDFSHFLRILQGQNDKKAEAKRASGLNLKVSSIYNFTKKFEDYNSDKFSIQKELNSLKSPPYPEREICEVLKKELKKTENIHLILDVSTSESSAEKSGQSARPLKRETILSRNSSIDSTVSDGSRKDAKVVNSKNELYTVGLTPRLELFADAIPKLIAEKSNENLRKQVQEKMDKVKDLEILAKPKTKIEEQTNSEGYKTYNNDHSKSAGKSHSNGETPRRVDLQKNILESPRNDFMSNTSATGKKVMKFCISKSYDQIPESIAKSQPPINDVKPTKSVPTSQKLTNPILKKSPLSKSKSNPKLIFKSMTRLRLSPKPKKDSSKFSSTSCLATSSQKTIINSAENLLKHTLAGGDTNHILSKSDCETLCKEERHKNYLLKAQLDSEAKLYKTQMERMRTLFEEELFALKKHNIVLKAKVNELSVNQRKPEIQLKSDTKVLMLERELEKQESLLQSYETENKKLMAEVKQLQEEMKNVHLKQRPLSVDATENQQLIDEIKDLQEEILKLNLEISSLREKNNDYTMKNEDLSEQNSLLGDELDMFKDQLRTKNDYISNQLQTMTKSESALRKELEESKVELNAKSEQLRGLKLEFDITQRNILPLEKEIMELRVKETNFEEKLQTAKSHIEREKQLSQKLKDQVIIDNKKIIDLNRQIREMEKILKRKNPDSVSALILTTNSEPDRTNAVKVKLLEERILSLENEITMKEDIAQQKFVDLLKKFSEMKERYVNQIMELEQKLLESIVQNQKASNDVFTQTTPKVMENKNIDSLKKDDRDKITFNEKDLKQAKIGSKTQNVKEDTHLIATIRGLKLELSKRDKTLVKLTKDLQELQKTNRKLQKEREKLLNDKKTCRNLPDLDKISRSTGSDSRPTSSKTSDGNYQHSNFYQNGPSPNSNSDHRLSSSSQKLYNPLQYSENSENYLSKKLTNENLILREELDKINKDFMALKNKRLHDLNLLQEEHEREMASVIRKYSGKLGDSKAIKLKGQINTQRAIISHLKQQIEKFRDYKDPVIVWKMERQHLENKVKSLTEKVKYLSTPRTEQLQLLQDKITMLQQRHENREMTLQNLVRDLLRSRKQCRDCKDEKDSNVQNDDVEEVDDPEEMTTHQTSDSEDEEDFA